MTDEEIATEIETCRRYVMESKLDEDAKDGLRARLRAAKSGDIREVMVLQTCSEVRDRVREGARMDAIAVAAARAAIDAHAENCAARAALAAVPAAPASPRLAAFRAWNAEIHRYIRPAAVVLCVVGASGSLPELLAFLRSLIKVKAGG